MAEPAIQHKLQEQYSNLKLLPCNKQVQALHTIIRDKNTSREDFVFYSDRLIRLLVEEGIR